MVIIIKGRGVSENWWTGQLWSEEAGGNSVKWRPGCDRAVVPGVGWGGLWVTVRIQWRELGCDGVTIWTLMLPRAWGGEDWSRVVKALNEWTWVAHGIARRCEAQSGRAVWECLGRGQEQPPSGRVVWRRAAVAFVESYSRAFPGVSVLHSWWPRGVSGARWHLLCCDSEI